VVKAARRARRSGEAADFHRLRIRCKRLRYSLEFGAELYDGRTSRYICRLTGLQDQLGFLQDAEVAANRLAELASGETRLPAATIFVMGGVAEQHRQEILRLLHQLPDEVSCVGGRRWQELATTMERAREQQLELVPPSPVRRVLRSVPVPPAAPEVAVDEPRPVTPYVVVESGSPASRSGPPRSVIEFDTDSGGDSSDVNVGSLERRSVP
jgi:hypothetical protein